MIRSLLSFIALVLLIHSTGVGQAQAKQSQQVVNINTATEVELQTLTGIGAKKAKAIIEYRKRQRFQKIEDLTNVKGIGQGLFKKLRPSIVVSGATKLAKPIKKGKKSPAAS